MKILQQVCYLVIGTFRLMTKKLQNSLELKYFSRQYIATNCNRRQYPMLLHYRKPVEYATIVSYSNTTLVGMNQLQLVLNSKN